MNIGYYLVSSFYIVRSLFRFSEHITNYIISKKVLDLPITKHEKINECIYSSIHGTVVSLMAGCSITDNYLIDNKLQYMTTSICFSYFLIDLIKCLYHQKYLFIIHHLASLYLLGFTIYSLHYNENKGHYAMYLIFLLESNTLLLNIGFLLKELKFHYSITCSVWIIHLLCFILFRIITIPKIIFNYYYNENINVISIMQLPAFLLIFSGSVYWSYRQAIGINKYLKENCVI